MKNLIKYKIILLFVIMTSFSSCSNNDDNEVETSNIIGTWKLVSDIFEGEENVNEGDCDVLYIFTESTIAIEEYYGASCQQVDLEDNTWEYEIVGDIIPGFDFEIGDARIVILNDTTLKLEFPEFGDDNSITMIRQ